MYQQVKLGDEFKLYRGSSPRPIINYISNNNSDPYWIKIGDMPENGYIVNSIKEHISIEGAKKSRRVYKGDMILSNSMSFGKPYILNVDGFIHDGWFVIRNYERSFDRDYLRYLLASPTVQKRYSQIAAGGVVLNISSDLVNSVIVKIPSLDEQKKISLFLSVLDERIQAQNKIIEDLITLRNQINNVFFDSLNTCVRFSELYTFASEGGTPDTSKSEYYLNGTIPFIKIENLYEKYLLSSNSIISESGLRNSSAWLVPKESILLSNGATIGETTILKMDAATKQGILGIIPKKPYDSEILYYLFKSRRFAKTLKRITTKGTMEAAYLKDLNKEKVFLSCDENMNSHVTLMSLIDKRINVERQIANLLVKEKQYLLGNLFI